jgi:hypothetical protein
MLSVVSRKEEVSREARLALAQMSADMDRDESWLRRNLILSFGYGVSIHLVATIPGNSGSMATRHVKRLQSLTSFRTSDMETGLY